MPIFRGLSTGIKKATLATETGRPWHPGSYPLCPKRGNCRCIRSSVQVRIHRQSACWCTGSRTGGKKPPTIVAPTSGLVLEAPLP